jgi:pimeloyl-ACP methyl ester carboxylesterase
MTTAVLVPRGGDSSDIVMIHGDFGDGQESWGRACDLIGRRYRTLVVDRPGFGVHLGPDDWFSIAGEASYVRGAVDKMFLPSFHLVGHSYGALVALEMAIARPDGIRSLHLVEPPLLDLLPEQPLVQEMNRRVRAIVANHATVGDEATTKAFFSMIGAERAVERMQGTAEWDRLCAYASRFARGEPASDYPRGALDRLRGDIPVTLYTGGRSHPALRLITAELATIIDRARVVDVAEAGHTVQMSGQVFVDALLGIVGEVDRGWKARVSLPSGDPTGE